MIEELRRAITSTLVPQAHLISPIGNILLLWTYIRVFIRVFMFNVTNKCYRRTSSVYKHREHYPAFEVSTVIGRSYAALSWHLPRAVQVQRLTRNKKIELFFHDSIGSNVVHFFSNSNSVNLPKIMSDMRTIPGFRFFAYRFSDDEAAAATLAIFAVAAIGMW